MPPTHSQRGTFSNGIYYQIKNMLFYVNSIAFIVIVSVLFLLFELLVFAEISSFQIYYT